MYALVQTAWVRSSHVACSDGCDWLALHAFDHHHRDNAFRPIKVQISYSYVVCI